MAFIYDCIDVVLGRVREGFTCIPNEQSDLQNHLKSNHRYQKHYTTVTYSKAPSIPSLQCIKH